MIEIAVIGKPTDAQREAFKAAKQELGVTEPMKFVPAKPGADRVLLFDADNLAVPPFACRWITLYHSDGRDVRDTLAWYLGAHDWRAADIDHWLEEVFQRGGVREVA